MRKSDFDNIIKSNLIAYIGIDNFGYTVSKTGKTYSDYYNNLVFARFIEEMNSDRYRDAFRAYNAGKGSELNENRGRYGKMPPKTASVASSSRFCYLALRDGARALGGSGQVKFEYACAIPGMSGIPPQLDAYISVDNTYIEVKCHEIFDSHRIVLKEKYWDYIYGVDNKFGFPVLERLSGSEFEIPLAAFGIKKFRSMFDIKQFLCHLLGIAAQKNDSATLVYLFFKPKAEQPDDKQEIDVLFDTLTAEVNAIFNSKPIQQFCMNYKIKLWAVAEYAQIMEALNKDNMIILAGI